MSKIGRQERKHYINYADYLGLRSRLIHLTEPDSNGSAEGTYKIRSLYFDNYEDKAVAEKLSGISRREKFRLRYYNNDPSFIRLEKKSKSNRFGFKESTGITQYQCQQILDGNYGFLKESEKPLFQELYLKIHIQQLRPKNIVDYMREAYIYRIGNVRITFDTNIRTSNNIYGFLDSDLVTIPSANAMILEVKFDAFLPEIMRDMIQLGNHNETEFSKYVVSRLV